MTFEYMMLQMPPNIALSGGNVQGNEAAAYLQKIVNEQAFKGWEFYRVDVLGVQTPAGCLGGGTPNLRQYYVVTFRKPI